MSTLRAYSCLLALLISPSNNRVAVEIQRKVLRDIDPKKLEAGYTLDKGTTYCDGLPAATVIPRKANSLHFAKLVKAHVI